ncbi:MAG: bis(5'-nucleosyl)-tetraphosphatase [bacterium]|nr:bis(5'-nucleosyl)-tetraphosphatase [bacterium]
MAKQISAGIVIYRRDKDGIKFLLLYHGGRYWNFAKGHLEENERSFEAAIREVKEETGIEKQDLIFKNSFRINDSFTFTYEKQKIFKIVIYYLAESLKKEIKISDEHQGFAWLPYEEARRLLMHPQLKNILKKAYDTINQRKSLSDNQKNPVGPRRDLQNNRPANRPAQSFPSHRPNPPQQPPSGHRTLPSNH